MSRVSYNEDDLWAAIRWGGAAKQAINGKRGQKVLRELRQALLNMPRKRLAYSSLVSPLGDYCVLGVLAKSRGFGRWTLEKVDERTFEWRGGLDIPEWAAEHLGITQTLAWELMEKNDEDRPRRTPEQRYAYVLRWVEAHIKPMVLDPAGKGEA